MMIRPDVVLEDVDMHHPPQNLFMETTAGRVTLFSGADTERPEYWPPVLHFGPPGAGPEPRHAPVHVPVPLCDAGRNSFVEIGR